MHKNILTVVGITILFLGLSIQPSVATIQPESIDTEYYDITTEFIGLGKEFTVQLTQQQMDELDLLFEDIREQLNNSESKEETIQIYNNAIKRLDGLGLLGDYSVKQVQELVTGRFQNPMFNHLIKKLSNRFLLDDDFNMFCIISGSTTDTFVLPLSTVFIQRFISKMENLPYAIFYILIPFLQLLLFFNWLRVFVGYRIPITLGSGISFGFYGALSNNYIPANGWIHTYGMFGHNKWDNNFYGQISEYYLFFGVLYIGVNGFIGLKIHDMNSFDYYYLGFANYVNIGSEPPDWELPH